MDGNVATVSIEVTPVNDPPVADAGPSPKVVRRDIALLDGSRSSDVDGNPLTYRWTIVSQPPHSKAQLAGASTVRPSFKADKEGTYVVRLIVNDGIIDSAPSEVTVLTSKNNHQLNGKSDIDED